MIHDLLYVRGSFDYDSYSIEWEGANLAVLMDCVGDVPYSVTSEVGKYGESLKMKRQWDPRHEASLGAAGPSLQFNGFHFMIRRNNQGITFQDTEEESEYNENLIAIHKLLTEPGGERGGIIPGLERRPRHSWSAFATIHRKITLGKFIEAVQMVHGAVRTIHIGTRLKLQHGRTVRAALSCGAPMVLDMSIEEPYVDGIEVYKVPEEGLSRLKIESHNWHVAFDGEHYTWTWYSAKNEAAAEHVALLKSVLARCGCSTTTFDILVEWAAGKRPRRAAVQLLLYRHTLKVFEYIAEHQLTDSQLTGARPESVGQMEDRLVCRCEIELENAHLNLALFCLWSVWNVLAGGGKVSATKGAKGPSQQGGARRNAFSYRAEGGGLDARRTEHPR